MKKILLTATMLVGFAAVSQAQQGRVGINTTTPSATLDVVANTTDNNRPDALLVPRMTRAQLEAKDAAYITGTVAAPGAQNGALVYVTALGGTGTGKTVNVTAPGFYYFNATDSASPTANAWIAVGGGGAATPQRYEGIRGTTTVTTAASYAPTATDYFVVTNSASGTVLNFPNLTAADAGRTIYVFNNNTAGNNTVNNVTGIIAMTPLRGYAILWSGTTWFSLTK